MVKIKNFEVFSWDNGNANEKFIYQNQIGEITGIMFPSLTTEVLEENLFFDFQENNIFKKNYMKMKYEGITHCIGKLAQEQDSKGGNRDQLSDKFKTNSAIVKLLSGIALAVNTEDVNVINIENLMLGLSINIFKENKTKIEEFYQNRKFEFEIPAKNGYKKYVVSIQRVICIPQGVGAFYDEVLDFTGYPKRADLLKKRYLLIDGGGGTTEYFIADGKKPIFGTEKCITMGANDIFQKIGSYYNNAPAQIIETIFREKDPNQYWNSKEPIPLDQVIDICEQAFEKRARYLYQIINDDLKEQLNRVGTVLICGGIVDYIYNRLQNSFGERYEVIKSQNPLYSNARGYYKYCMLIEMKKRLKRISS